MTVTERRIPVPGGDLAVIDHGGSGPDVLLLHSSGHNAHTWADLAPLLARHAHVYALDLRGHGQSTAQVTDGSAQIRDDVLTVVAELGLRRPVIVGHEFGGLWAVAAAYEHEDLGGLVLIDSPVVDPTDAVRDLVSMIADPVVLDLLVERFGLGVSGPDAASLDEYADGYVERIRSDWLARTFDADAARRLVLRGCSSPPTDRGRGSRRSRRSRISPRSRRTTPTTRAGSSWRPSTPRSSSSRSPRATSCRAATRSSSRPRTRTGRSSPSTLTPRR